MADEKGLKTSIQKLKCLFWQGLFHELFIFAKIYFSGMKVNRFCNFVRFRYLILTLTFIYRKIVYFHFLPNFSAATPLFTDIIVDIHEEVYMHT